MVKFIQHEEAAIVSRGCAAEDIKNDLPLRAVGREELVYPINSFGRLLGLHLGGGELINEPGPQEVDVIQGHAVDGDDREGGRYGRFGDDRIDDSGLASARGP